MKILSTFLYVCKISVLSIGGFLCLAATTSAAELYLTPQTVTPHQSEVFTVDLVMSSTEEPINAAAATVTYDTQALQLVTYRRTSEKVSFWIESEDDPWDGSIRLEGLLVDQGWQGDAEQLAQLTFRTIANGETSITLDEVALHAYDGTGENIIERAISAQVTVLEKKPRSEYAYEATGFPAVTGRVSTDILYDADYAREYRVLHLTPWWVWVVLALSVALFLYTILQVRNCCDACRKKKR